MWSVTNYFLVNLTLADLMMATLNCIPSFIFMRDRLETYYFLNAEIWKRSNMKFLCLTKKTADTTVHILLCFLRGGIKTKNVPNCGKSPKGGRVSAKIKKVYISNVDSLWLNFSDFSQIQITEIWPWFLWYMGLTLMRYMQHLVHIWPILPSSSSTSTQKADPATHPPNQNSLFFRLQFC